MSKIKPSGIVYSTNPDFKYSLEKQNIEPITLPPQQQNLRVGIERKHRGGKTVSIVDGFIGTISDLEILEKLLKTRCGVGGSAKDNQIIIQGDVRDKIFDLLIKLGYKVKKSGG